MNNQSTARIVANLKDVLLSERTLLRSGQVHDVVALSGEKLQAVEAFESMLAMNPPVGLSSSDRQGVREIVEMAKQNAIILESVRNGLRSAATRLENLDGGATVGAYDRYGASLPFSGATGGYVKRV